MSTASGDFSDEIPLYLKAPGAKKEILTKIDLVKQQNSVLKESISHFQQMIIKENTTFKHKKNQNESDTSANKVLSTQLQNQLRDANQEKLNIERRIATIKTKQSQCENDAIRIKTERVQLNYEQNDTNSRVRKHQETVQINTDLIKANMDIIQKHQLDIWLINEYDVSLQKRRQKEQVLIAKIQALQRQQKNLYQTPGNYSDEEEGGQQQQQQRFNNYSSHNQSNQTESNNESHNANIPQNRMLRRYSDNVSPHPKHGYNGPTQTESKSHNANIPQNPMLRRYSDNVSPHPKHGYNALAEQKQRDIQDQFVNRHEKNKFTQMEIEWGVLTGAAKNRLGTVVYFVDPKLKWNQFKREWEYGGGHGLLSILNNFTNLYEEAFMVISGFTNYDPIGCGTHNAKDEQCCFLTWTLPDNSLLSQHKGMTLLCDVKIVNSVRKGVQLIAYRVRLPNGDMWKRQFTNCKRNRHERGTGLVISDNGW